MARFGQELSRYEAPLTPWTAQARAAYLRNPPMQSRFGSGRPAILSPASADVQPTMPQGPDPNQLPPEIQAQLAALYPQQPQMQGPQGFNVGPFSIPGAPLDAAAAAMQNGMQNMPAPRNFGQGLVGGFVGGLSGARVNAAMGRAQANQNSATEYQKQLDAYKQAASEAGRQLAGHRYRMKEIAAEQAGKPVTDPMVDITTPAMQSFFRRVKFQAPPGVSQMKQSELAALGRPTAAEKNPTNSPDEGDFAGNVEHNVDGTPYLNYSRWGGKDKNAAIKFAVANGMRALSQPEADGIKEVDNAKLNIQTMQQRIHDILPADWQARIAQSPGIKMSQLLQTNDNRAAFGDMRVAAIQQIRALVTKGLRLNMAEINLAVNNDIPQLTDTYATAMRRTNDLNDFLSNAANSVLMLDRSKMVKKPDATKPQPVVAKPAQPGGWFDSNK